MRSSGQAIDSNSQINWQVLKQLLPYLTEFKGRVILALGFLILAKLSAIALPFILKLIVDSLNNEPIKTFPFSSFIPIELIVPVTLVFAYGFFRFFNVIFGEIRDTLFSRVTERTIRRVSLKAFQHLHTLDIEFHLNRRTGGLAREIERGTHGINFIMRFMVFNIIPTLIEILLVVSILLTNYGISFGVITTFSIIIYIAFSVITTNWRNQYVRATNEADSNSGSRAIDSLLNYETVKSFTNEKFESERYDSDLKIWEKAKTKSRLTLLILNGGQALIISSAITILLYLAVEQVTLNEMTVGDFVLINAFMMQLFIPLNFLGFIYREIKVAFVNIEKMLTLLARQPKIQDLPNAEQLIAINQTIQFNNVSFSYEKNREILHKISLTIKPKQTVAIVGSSGAGKSTIAKLMMRFYDPNNGEVLIGKHNLTQVSQQSLRNSIGIVPQDTILFNDSIMENIRYGNPQASDEEVYRAIEMAHLNFFIEQLPNGVNTQVGERGLKLSGGEKQRVAIARALVKKPPIMIFDEATSSLDSHSETAILKAIKEISENYTSLVIAHRLSTIIHADQIIVLEQGKIKESGDHQTLLAFGGIYNQLWHAQQKSKNNGL